MDDNNYMNDLYLIPKNINAKFQLLPGFGWRELFVTLSFMGVGGVIALILHLFNAPIFLLFIIVVLFGAAGYMLSMEDPRTGMSLLRVMKSMRKFKQKQNMYFYILRRR